jgi:hypothetical protein
MQKTPCYGWFQSSHSPNDVSPQPNGTVSVQESCKTITPLYGQPHKHTRALTVKPV